MNESEQARRKQINKMAWVFIAGFFLGLVATTLMAVPGITRAQDEAVELGGLLRAQADKTALCEARERELTGTSTLLFDYAATQPSGADKAAAFLGAQLFGLRVPQTKVDGPRWFIPAKVEPIVYGAPGGTTYLWVDKKTKKVTGPLTPQVQP
jgi:hypothetical protein